MQVLEQHEISTAPSSSSSLDLTAVGVGHSEDNAAPAWQYSLQDSLGTPALLEHWRDAHLPQVMGCTQEGGKDGPQANTAARF